MTPEREREIVEAALRRIAKLGVCYMGPKTYFELRTALQETDYGWHHALGHREPPVPGPVAIRVRRWLPEGGVYADPVSEAYDVAADRPLVLWNIILSWKALLEPRSLLAPRSLIWVVRDSGLVR